MIIIKCNKVMVINKDFKIIPSKVKDKIITLTKISHNFMLRIILSKNQSKDNKFFKEKAQNHWVNLREQKYNSNSNVLEK